jgi:hypothetical protein
LYLLQNASLDLKCSNGASDAASGDEGAAHLPAAAALLQAACDLCVPLAPAALLPQQQVQLVRFYLKASCFADALRASVCPTTAAAVSWRKAAYLQGQGS